MRGVLFQFSVFSHREQMGVDVVPVSIDINVPAIFEQRNRGDYIRALWSRGTSSIGLAKSEAVHARGGFVLRLDIYEFEASATRERGYVHRVQIVLPFTGVTVGVLVFTQRKQE